MDKDVTDVSIPASLYKKIEDAIKGTEFASVADYVTKTLREKLSQAAGPADGFTKEDLAAYYRDVAPVLLPHMKGRPIVGQRWPDGIDEADERDLTYVGVVGIIDPPLDHEH